jgi:hypothetical protein
MGLRIEDAAKLGTALVFAGMTGLALADGRPMRVDSVRASVVPARLSETGLYTADGSIDPRNRPFAPQYPLWTDGAAKSRWVYLPAATKIDVSDVDAWSFPAGTTFWKEFAWGGRKVETRMIRIGAGGEPTFATYVWTEDQNDAVLAPADGAPLAHEIAPGKHHSIPAVADCVACHRSAPSIALGFGALQLSDDRDPLAPHAETLRPGSLTLRTLVDENLIEPARPELVAQPPRIRDADPVGRAAQGYLSANCGGCHNDRGPLARLGFNLLHKVGEGAVAEEPARATAIGAPTRYVCSSATADQCRVIAAGDPENSALFQRMRSRRASSQMPPLGTVVADDEAVELVRRWIESLGPQYGMAK